MGSKRIFLADLVDMDNPRAVFAEVSNIANLIDRGYDSRAIRHVFTDMLRLYAGDIHGYNRCTTEYHNVKHVTDAMLSMARLIHGVALSGVSISSESVALGLISALLHDTGYIQKKSDRNGTGAKYTLVHVDRSIEFMRKYLKKSGFSKKQIAFCRGVIACTCLNTKPTDVDFVSDENALFGEMQGTADILGQMADRTYLEKLLFLFQEFNECGIMGAAGEMELLRKTLDFYEMSKRRLEVDLGNVRRFMVNHFRKRWNVDQDLYQSAIENNIAFLKHLLVEHEHDYRKKLKRGGIVRRLSQKRL